MAATRKAARAPKNKARARRARPLVRVTGALGSKDLGAVAHKSLDAMGHEVTYLDGRGYGKMLARQLAETYQDAGFRVTGSSAHGYVVEDRYGVRGRIDVVDEVGPFGPVVSS